LDKKKCPENPKAPTSWCLSQEKDGFRPFLYWTLEKKQKIKKNGMKKQN